ncbi:hypothetical protein LEP1GSC193_3649 [Leptospira alstonii serovar Pingchang str. 80-412]|uniref:Uncharacterized protein n=2 Tax=Leptospira alstonii TaxID=28452 RepID=M6CVY6_9LEPT|nr:hypothetical protein LEP1GSC194_0783 [Leptospira alstonii serovar Sichuan str. 79601]EQA81283.1 hypothetical protein LEP1GSC193_3649 [Leptospira alstonii serovar Pingchang str. 80-412]
MFVSSSLAAPRAVIPLICKILSKIPRFNRFSESLKPVFFGSRLGL